MLCSMVTKQAEILFICGSPRSHASEALLALLEQGVRKAGARSRRFLLSKKRISPCAGCGWCEKTGTCILADKRAETRVSDDYLELLDALEHADALAVVSPLFFAGPPAQLKALYDRMQPFWSRKYLLGQETPAKRPAQLFILGGGGDAHGYEPLVTISRSSLAVAGYSIEKIQNFIGFKHSSDLASLPTEEEAANMAFGELAHARKAVTKQRSFEKRAIVAGSAFARFVNKSIEKRELEAELEQVEAEIEELKTEKITPNLLLEYDLDLEQESDDQIMDYVDTEFEALKQAARASKSSSVDAVAAIREYKAASEEFDEAETTEEPRVRAVSSDDQDSIIELSMSADTSSASVKNGDSAPSNKPSKDSAGSAPPQDDTDSISPKDNATAS